jgi:ribosomal protein S18 acetylase RimI-like enzyme
MNLESKFTNAKINLTFRKAELKDLEGIVRMLADDFLGGKREDFKIPLPQGYLDAFEKIDQDQSTLLVVVDDEEKNLVGTMQLIFIFGLSFRGRTKMKIEAVRVNEKLRNRGIGKTMMDWAIEEGKKRGCGKIQLVTSVERKDTHRFYHRIGFESSSLLAMELDIKN